MTWQDGKLGGCEHEGEPGESLISCCLRLLVRGGAAGHVVERNADKNPPFRHTATSCWQPTVKRRREEDVTLQQLMKFNECLLSRCLARCHRDERHW